MDQRCLLGVAFVMVLSGCTSTMSLVWAAVMNKGMLEARDLPIQATAAGLLSFTSEEELPYVEGPSAKEVRLSLQSYSRLCHPQGLLRVGKEGKRSEGFVLEKAFSLVVSARGSGHQETETEFPGLVSSCRFSHYAAKSSTKKVRDFPEIAADFKQMHGSKSGLNIFDMMPLSDACGSHDVTPHAIAGLIQVGGFLAKRFGHLLPSLDVDSKNGVSLLASCIPEQPYFQSASALLHGLLGDKQFLGLGGVKKLDRHVVRDWGSYSWCPHIREVEAFFEKSYRAEVDLFNTAQSRFVHHKHLQEGLRLERPRPAKEIIHSLIHRVCPSGGRVQCDGEKCLNLTDDSVNQLLEAYAEHSSYLIKKRLFRSYAVADTYLYVEKLFSWFGGERNSRQVIKIDVVDDFFFLKVLAALGHLAKEPVLPGSRLVIEQYRKEKSNKSAKFWKVLVDGEVVTEDLIVSSGAASKGLAGVDTLKESWNELVNNNTFDMCAQFRDEL